MFRIKICGNRTLDEIELAVSLGADALGLIVGVRHRSEDALDVGTAEALRSAIPDTRLSVLVTHQVSAPKVIELHEAVPTSALQLHDDIPAEDLAIIRKLRPQTLLIKAIPVEDRSAIDAALKFEPLVDALLLDSRTGDRIGGTGVPHDWTISREIVKRVQCPVILAGGLTPENIAEAIDTVKPYGVDVNSGVEFKDGAKDPEKERLFIETAARRLKTRDEKS
jgi:phosphoribosylanthranilate isomerase